MKVLYKNKINNNMPNLTIDKYYEIVDIRKWNNEVVQYLIMDDCGYRNWFSASRFNNRKEKLNKINEINRD